LTVGAGVNRAIGNYGAADGFCLIRHKHESEPTVFRSARGSRTALKLDHVGNGIAAFIRDLDAIFGGIVN
jgi:tRNA C32,U32 (ribose-2'-O)-methylase TrmJ